MASILRRYPSLDFTYLRWQLAEWWEGWQPTFLQKRAAGIAAFIALGTLLGIIVAVLGLGGAVVCISAFASIFVLRDFRVGVAMLVLMMPISQSYVFPHEMFGLTGLNPLNLLVVATLLALYMRWLGHGMLKGFVPRSLFLFYIAPLLMGALIGMFRWDEIPSIFVELDMLSVTSEASYWRDMFLKPMMFVVYALLVACAVQKSERPERFLTPMII